MGALVLAGALLTLRFHQASILESAYNIIPFSTETVAAQWVNDAGEDTGTYGSIPAGVIAKERLKYLSGRRILTRSAKSFIPPQRYCLIHVGKTAGSAISCEVCGLQDRRELKCSKTVQKTKPSALQRAFAGRYHMLGQRKRCERAFERREFREFIVTLRNPIDRITSWYYYEHPATITSKYRNHCHLKQLHRWVNSTDGCFASLDEFARSAMPRNQSGYNRGEQLTKDSKGNRVVCSDLAYKVASGKTPCPAHHFFNYQYYEQSIQKMSKELNIARKVRLFAIRTEHLASDWDGLESLYSMSTSPSSTNLYSMSTSPSSANGQQQKLLGAGRFQVRSGTVTSGKSSIGLSNEGRKALCAALCLDIQAYKRLLYRAQNLEMNEVMRSLDELRLTCPEETYTVREC